MRRRERTTTWCRTIAVIGAVLLVAGPLRAQRWEPPTGVATPRATRADALSLPRPATHDGKPPTTLVDRYVLALATAAIAGQATVQSGGSGQLAFAAYLAGSAGGALLAGHMREGARPLPVLAGTLLGAAPIWLVLANPRPGDDYGHAIVLLWTGLFTTPLGSALGHEWGAR